MAPRPPSIKDANSRQAGEDAVSEPDAGELAGLHRMSAPQSFRTQVERTLRERSAGRFFGRRAFGDRVPFGVLAVVALLVGLIIVALVWSSHTGSLRYERNGSEPELPPAAREVVPRPQGLR